MLMKLLSLSLFSLANASCPLVKTLDLIHFDVNKYAGVWYDTSDINRYRDRLITCLLILIQYFIFYHWINVQQDKI